MGGELRKLELEELLEVLETPIHLSHVACEVVDEVRRMQQIRET